MSMWHCCCDTSAASKVLNWGGAPGWCGQALPKLQPSTVHSVAVHRPSQQLYRQRQPYSPLSFTLPFLPLNPQL